MNSNDFFQNIHLKEDSATPKYLQVANSIIDLIKRGQIHPSQLLPSINEFNCNLDISRSTAERCYRYLKKGGILHSVPGRGFYPIIQKTRERPQILLLFNELSNQKNVLYNAFTSAICDYADVNTRVYYNNVSLFEKLLKNDRNYDYYVIIPHFKTGHEIAYELINQIPKERLLILEKQTRHIDGTYSSVIENREQNISKALIQALEKLKKYHTLKIIIPKDDVFPEETVNGLKNFCACNGFNYDIVDDLFNERISEGVVYIDLTEEDLVILVEKIAHSNLTIGKQVGLISYNDRPLKKIIANGITTISVDFKLMANMVAKLIKEKSKHHLEVPYVLNLRNSL